MTGHAYAGYSAAELHAEARRLAALQDPAMMGLYLHPGAYRVRAHTRLIGSVLAGLGGSGGADRLLVTTPPQVGKSVLVSELLPMWWLALRPADRIAIASYAGSLAMKKARAVRRLIADRGWEWGLTLQHGEQTGYDWALTAGGGVRAVGVGGGLTGHPITGVGIVDDPHKDRREADSPLVREHVWDWWSSVFLSRLRPGVPVVLCMTRWHPDDLAGRVLAHEGTLDEGGRWRVLHLPALAESADPLGRAPGDPLTHPALSDDDHAGLLAHWHDKRRTSTPRDWGALYMGDPQPAEGALLTHAEMADAYCPSPAAPTRRAVAVDPSGGGRDTAGVVAGYLGTDQRLYLTHDRTRRMSSDRWARAACTLAAETEATLILVEKNYGGDMVTLSIRTAWDALQREGTVPADALPPFVQPVTARTGKLLRAEPVAQQWREDRVRLAAHLPELVSEWVSWQPGSDSPGRIDASVYLAYGLLRAPAARETISSPAGVSLSSVGQGRGGLGAASIGRSGYVR